MFRIFTRTRARNRRALADALRRAENERIYWLYRQVGDIVYPHENRDGSIHWARI